MGSWQGHGPIYPSANEFQRTDGSVPLSHPAEPQQVNHVWASSDPHDPELCPTCNPDLDPRVKIHNPHRPLAVGEVFQAGRMLVRVAEGVDPSGRVTYGVLIGSDQDSLSLTVTPRADGTADFGVKA